MHFYSIVRYVQTYITSPQQRLARKALTYNYEKKKKKRKGMKIKEILFIIGFILWDDELNTLFYCSCLL